MLITTIIILSVVVLFFIVAYNGLIARRNAVENAFASIDTMLKKRYDLIPNLVATVKEYAKHESSTLEKITSLRAKAMSGNISSEEAVELNNQITQSLGGIMVAVESYPELKANENFMQLQRSLNETEEQISASRRAFNAAVTDYNNAVEMFPTNILAGMMSFKRRTLFEIPETERQNIDVKNLFNS
jgi:LemA protein